MGVRYSFLPYTIATFNDCQDFDGYRQQENFLKAVNTFKMIFEAFVQKELSSHFLNNILQNVPAKFIGPYFLIFGSAQYIEVELKKIYPTAKIVISRGKNEFEIRVFQKFFKLPVPKLFKNLENNRQEFDKIYLDDLIFFHKGQFLAKFKNYQSLCLYVSFFMEYDSNNEFIIKPEDQYGQVSESQNLTAKKLEELCCKFNWCKNF